MRRLEVEVKHPFRFEAQLNRNGLWWTLHFVCAFSGYIDAGGEMH